MSRIPKDPAEIFGEFTEDAKRVFGDDLVSILLYGSGAKGEYRYKKSDINFMIVLTEEGIDRLNRFLPLITAWRNRRVSTPLFLTKEYIVSSLDSFPIEFFEMQRHHQLVYGADVLQNLDIRKEHLRIQCERELKGKLLQLRESFLNTAHSDRQMKSLISQSLTTFAPIFSGMLKLRRDQVPDKRRDIFKEIVETYSLDGELFDELFRIREQNPKYSKHMLLTVMERYIQQIKKLVNTIDQL